MRGDKRGWTLRLYLALARRAAPLWRISLRRRVGRGKEDAARLAEREGVASAARAPGPVLWLHALGLGEAVALLSVIRAVAQGRGDVQIVLTTNTRTGADGLAKLGLPGACVHQYAPMEAAAALARFLDHWRPDAVVVAELDLWPLMLDCLRARGIPVMMANARLTDHRFAGRKRMGRMFGDVLAMLRLMLVQDGLTRERLIALGADPARVRVAGLLKAAAEPLPDQVAARQALAVAIGGRPVWLAAATEGREDAVVLEAHRLARRVLPDLLLILAPRQLSDAANTAARCVAVFGSVAQRSKAAMPAREDAVYLADTVGEMGLWYRLAPISFIGHSLVMPEGRALTGKNPFEAVALGSTVVHGPAVGNFAESYAALAAVGGARMVGDAAELAAAVTGALRHEDMRAACAQRASLVLEQGQAALQQTVDAVLGLLPPAR